MTRQVDNRDIVGSMNPLSHRIHLTIELTPSDGGYASGVIEYPGVHAQGDTRDEAFINALSALLDWAEAPETIAVVDAQFAAALEWTLREHRETLERLGG
jgi:predicted RNase H-like HicB family nuclease